MITTLAKLGLNQHISIILDFGEKEVTVTVLFKPKTDGQPAMPPLQFSGTPAEVEEHLNSPGFAESFAKLEGLRTNLAEAEALLKEEQKAKETERKKANEAKPETAAPAGKKSRPGKPAPAASSEPPEAPPSTSTTVPAGLTPAWKGKPTAAPTETAPAPAAGGTAADDELEALFEEEQQK